MRKTKLLDDDIGILKLLQEGLLNKEEIARRLDMPSRTVASRIKKFREKGIIKAIKANLDPAKLGRPLTLFIMISVAHEEIPRMEGAQREVAERIADSDLIEEIHLITGEYDLLVKVRVQNVEEVERFVVDTLRLNEGVQKSVSFLSLRTIKDTTKIPLNNMKTPFEIENPSSSTVTEENDTIDHVDPVKLEAKSEHLWACDLG